MEGGTEACQPEEEVYNPGGEIPGNVQVEKQEAEPVWKNEVRTYARDFFESIYSNKKELNRFVDFYDTQDKLSIISDCEKEWTEERRYTKNFREATEIFLNELIDFSTEVDRADSNKSSEFLNNIHETFFSSSPNIASALYLGSYFDFAARATRSASLQAYIGGGIIDELAGNIGWHYDPESGKDDIFESYEKSDIPGKLDKLNLMEMLHAELIAKGGSYNYRGGKTKIDTLLQGIKRSNENAFIGFYIDSVEDRFKQEYRNPTMGVLNRGDERDARLQERMTNKQIKESLKLQISTIIDIPQKYVTGRRLGQVAEDIIALFDHANAPIGYAQINLNEDEKRRITNFVDFDELSDENKNYLGNEKVEGGELLFRYLYNPAVRERIESEFKIKFNDLPFHYHVHFLKFLSEKNIDEAKKVKEFLIQAQSDEARKNRIKSFLSLGAGAERSDSILSIGENLDDQETADAIFAKYAEIADSASGIKEELAGMVKERGKGFSQLEIDSISRNLIEKANDMLAKFSVKVKITKDPGSVMAELEDYNKGLLLTTNAFKAIKQSGESVRPEDLEGVTFHRVAATQLKNSDQLVQMKKMYLENYEPEFGKVLIDGFQNLVDSDESGLTNVYYYEKNGKVMAFCRFDDKGHGEKYFGSCNVLESIKGDCIGGSMVEIAMGQETANGERVLADCRFKTPISSYYFEKMGFVARAALKYKDTKETLLAIERNSDNGEYEYRNGKYGANDIVAENKNFPNNNYEVGAERMVLKYTNNEAGINDLIQKANELFSSQYVMTRYIFDGGAIYCAFELESGGR